MSPITVKYARMVLYRNKILLNTIFSSIRYSVLASYVMEHIGRQDAVDLRENILLNIIFSSICYSVLASYVMEYTGRQDCLILKELYC